MCAADADRVTALILLDLSSAFDTVDHSIMLTVLQLKFGIDGSSAMLWSRSGHTDRSQAVVVNGSCSATSPVVCSVPHGSVLGPLKFISYTKDVTLIFDRHGASHHLFAEDKQAYADAPLSDVGRTSGQSTLQAAVGTECRGATHLWSTKIRPRDAAAS